MEGICWIFLSVLPEILYCLVNPDMVACLVIPHMVDCLVIPDIFNRESIFRFLFGLF